MTAELATRAGLPGRILDNGYIPPADLSFPELYGVLEMAELIVEASPWWLVDAVAELEARFPHEYHQMLPEGDEGPEGMRKAKLKQAGWMADRWPRGTRVPGVKFTHHRLVARLDRAEAVGLLESAADGKWSTRTLAREVEIRERAIAVSPNGHVDPSCAADREPDLTLADLLPEWRARAEATDSPRAYLQALLDTAQEACFGRWVG
jgi:hypothetical protein